MKKKETTDSLSQGFSSWNNIIDTTVNERFVRNNDETVLRDLKPRLDSDQSVALDLKENVE